MKKAAPIIIIVLILAGGAYAILHKSDDKKDSTASTTPSSITTDKKTSSDGSKSSNTSSSTTITYGDSGFSPSTLTVKTGTTVTIKNTSSRDMQFNSDPHPVHTDDPELNIGTVGPGESMTITTTVAGTHGYHNHLNPNDTGTLVVQ